MQYKLHNPHETLKFFPLRMKHIPKLSSSLKLIIPLLIKHYSIIISQEKFLQTSTVIYLSSITNTILDTS